MRLCRHGLLVAVLALPACVTGYLAVPDGRTTVGELRVASASGWSRAPNETTPWARRGTQVWTRNGLQLDRLVVIPGIEPGDSIYLDRGDEGFPAYRADMTTDALPTLLAETIELAQGGNTTRVVTNEVRPHRFGEHAGVLFALEATVLDGPAYAGLAGAFVAADDLYLLYFIAATPYYFEQSAADAEGIITSATL